MSGLSLESRRDAETEQAGPPLAGHLKPRLKYAKICRVRALIVTAEVLILSTSGQGAKSEKCPTGDRVPSAPDPIIRRAKLENGALQYSDLMRSLPTALRGFEIRSLWPPEMIGLPASP